MAVTNDLNKPTKHLNEHTSKHPHKNRDASEVSLASLTLAAMALPGLMMQPVSAAEGESVSVIYEHYSEGKRDLAGMNSNFQPIDVDTILGNINFTLTNDLTGTLTLTQDTWSGATPVATAPLSARGNRINTTHTHVTTGASVDDSGHIHDAESGEAANEGLPHSLTGASPYLYSSLKLDAQRRPLMTDSDGKVIIGADGGVDTRLVHTLSSASPEVRQQFDLTLSRDLKDAKVNVGGGLSQERDFDSLFGHVSGSWDLNRKLTTLSAGLSYSYNKTHALLDHDVVPHVYEPYMLTYERRGDDIYNRTFSSSRLDLDDHSASQTSGHSALQHNGNSPTLKGKRDDWGLNLGATHVINQGALLEAGLSFTHSFGYQSNPYKAVEVAFIDPLKQQGQAGGNALANYTYDAELVAVLEQRPDLRNQGSLSLKYIQHIQTTDAALHTGYRYFQDNWGIQAHTLDIEWIQPLTKTWTLSPRLRYYTQTQADFYTPYMVTDQGLYTRKPDAASTEDTIPFDRAKLPRHYSSDARLSAYGTLTAGIALTKTLRHGMSIELSYEHLRHAGNLKLGGKGEAPYADFDSYLFNIGLNIDLGERRLSSMPGSALDQDDAEHSEHAHHSAPHHTPAAPAGVQFDHLLENSGDLMFGYRVMAMQQGGEIKQNGKALSDYALINNACDGHPCYVRPTHMTMRMHMLDIMYAPTDWLTLMLMPQFVDMSMDMRLLNESPRTGGMDSIGMAITHAQHSHTSSGLGDTELHGLVSLFKWENAELHMGLGVSAPTADVGLKMRPMMGIDMGFLEYGMQLGSGTWDFKPSLTLTGQNTLLNTTLNTIVAWGAQVSTTQRLEGKNASGYALGNIVQSTLWGSYALNRSLSLSVRGLYTDQDTIKGKFNNTHIAIGAGDYTQNYGGRFADVGLGLSGNIETGSLAGTRWGVEWLQPVSDKANGYQLERKGTLVFNWGIHL